MQKVTVSDQWLYLDMYANPRDLRNTHSDSGRKSLQSQNSYKVDDIYQPVGRCKT